MTQLTKEAAQQLLFEQVHAPVFFDRLAQHGIRPGTEAEAETMLKSAANLHSQFDQIQQAQPKVHPLLQKFAAQVEAATTHLTSQTQEQDQVRQLAKLAAADPRLMAAYAAVATA